VRERLPLVSLFIERSERGERERERGEREREPRRERERERVPKTHLNGAY
jgi:hypothetical protein